MFRFKFIKLLKFMLSDLNIFKKFSMWSIKFSFNSSLFLVASNNKSKLLIIIGKRYEMLLLIELNNFGKISFFFTSFGTDLIILYMK